VKRALAAACVAALMSATRAHASTAGPDTLALRSGAFHLTGLLWRPQGAGPHAAVLFAHGSGHASGVGPAGPDHRHPERMGPLFARHGYVFLYLFRRGDGLSAGNGEASGDLMDREQRDHGEEARNWVQVRLLEDGELDDLLTGLRTLRRQPQVDPGRVAIVGVSFGASLALMAAERDSTLRATVAFSPAGYSWKRSPELRALLLGAVDHMAASAFFIHAANDYSTEPGQALAAEMEKLGKPHRVKIYPAIGLSPEDGHDFVDLGITAWERDVFGFLDQSLKR
jgi:dienelactone hydrolase